MVHNPQKKKVSELRLILWNQYHLHHPIVGMVFLALPRLLLTRLFKWPAASSSNSLREGLTFIHFRSCFFQFTLTPIILIFHFLSLLFELMKDCFFFNSFSRLKKNMKWVLSFQMNALGWNALFFCEFDKVTQFHCALNNFFFHYIPNLTY